jgi:hypothetical protein
MVAGREIHETLDLTILQGPLYVKIGVVELCRMPLVVTSQKTHVLPILATNKMENLFFNGNSKNPSYKTCWQWKMHITAKNGETDLYYNGI